MRWIRPIQRVPGAAAAALLALGLPAAAAAAPPCDAAGAGLALPAGFCATLVAEGVGAVRNLDVAANGDVFAATKGEPGGVLALRDSDGDGRADRRARFGPSQGHDVKLVAGFLYFAADDRVVRWPWPPGALEPAGPFETVALLPRQEEHSRKGMAFGPDHQLFVNVGAPSNSCQERNRELRSPGLDPCPELEAHAGVWRFRADVLDQRQTPERRFATGLRQAMALAVHPQSGELWAGINGRDLLGGNWGYSDERNAELPAEEFVRVRAGDDFGWPYCYYDGLAGRKVLAPEYGGDGGAEGRCAGKGRPAVVFPAHWAPMAIVFYSGQQFPERYRGGAFVAFRGSWNRAPLPQQGYQVSFVPFRDGAPRGGYESFASGSGDPVRFTGLAVGPEGSLYASADANQKIWRIQYRGH